MKTLKKCAACGSYTLKEKCVKTKCGGEHATTRAAHPPKYSPIDKYASYRRKEKYG